MELRPATLRPVLRQLNMAEAVAVVPLAGGSSPNYRLDLADGRQLVLKAYADDARWRNGKEAFAAAQLQDLPLPITRYLLIDDSGRLLPFPFSITNYLPGATLRSFFEHPDIESAFRQMGALQRQLHDVKMPTYGAFGPDGIVQPAGTNAGFIRRLIEGTFARFQHFGGDPDLAAKLRDIIEARFDAVVPHSPGAVFAHDDLHPGNVLATEAADGRLTLSGLIDFGNARAADAVFDLAKSLFCSGHEAPRSTAPILEGYGPIDHPDPRGALRYYTLLHRLSMWCWLRQVGSIPAADAPGDLISDLRKMAAEG